MNIVVVAQESAGVQTVRLVEDSAHDLVAVLTSDFPGSSGRGVTVSAIAHELDASVLPSELVRDPNFADELRRRQVDVLLNVHSLYLINADVLGAPRVGSFNLHPGPLPQYAGLNVPSWAIYHGEDKHAVTLHWVAPRVDAGPIAFESWFPIAPHDTGLSLSAKCVQHGLPLLSLLLGLLADDPNEIPKISQDPARRRYFGKNVPGQGWVSWLCSAEQVVDFVRACDYGPWPSPWRAPRTHSARSGLEIEILRASRTREGTTAAPGTVSASENGTVRVAAGDEWVRVSRARVNGTSAPPSSLLAPGDTLEART